MVGVRCRKKFVSLSLYRNEHDKTASTSCARADISGQRGSISSDERMNERKDERVPLHGVFVCDGDLLAFLEGCAQPVQTLIETVAGGGAACLDVPLAVAQTVKAEFVGHLGCVHSVGEVLLVGEDE